ncbi:hypothetical protein [Apilactobacillus xinyiensis]|uniref:hypothetical protein n=1 Tax=Apilactobacillus xinyiensis TaxID=2841032 RepID=UPI00200E9208|nr:hypothetical protein [Apilactobacillus xinyiensis]MCL0330657.1 hypothetical protein [Apilactobacillus xinyiensis]
MKIKNDYLTMLKSTDEEGLKRVRDFFNRNKTKKSAISSQDNGLSKTNYVSSIQQKEAE